MKDYGKLTDSVRVREVRSKVQHCIRIDVGGVEVMSIDVWATADDRPVLMAMCKADGEEWKPSVEGCVLYIHKATPI